MTSVRRFLPLLDWLPTYDRRNLRFDIVAGVTVAALVVPKSLGYAGIATVPIQNGLYAAAAGAFIYAIFGTSRQIATGPSSALAAVAAGAVVTTGVSGDDAPVIVAATTLLAGLLFGLLAVFRLGWISQFLSKPVITGFLFGAAIEVVIGELPKLTGTDADGENSWQKFGSWVSGVGDLDLSTLLVGTAALLVILVLRFTVPKLPGALVVLVGGLLASRIFDLSGRGLAMVGDVPRGLPSLDLPTGEVVWDNIGTIATAAAAIMLIGFSQTAGDARTFASRHQYRIDVDQESFAQGLSNVGAGLFQGIPVSTSLSASSLNDSAGARTQVASIVTAIVVVLTMLILAPVFSDLPKAVLSAIIVDAVVFGMMDVAEMRRMFRIKRFDFWIAVVALLGVLTAGVLAGVVIGVALSLGWLVYVSTQASMPRLGRRPGTTAFRPIDGHPDDETYPGLLVMRIDAGLSFVISDTLEDHLRTEVQRAHEPIRAIVIDFAGVNFVDSQGAAELGKIADLTSSAHVSLRLARVKADVLDVLQLDGTVDKIGADRFHDDVFDAVQAELGG